MTVRRPRIRPSGVALALAGAMALPACGAEAPAPVEEPPEATLRIAVAHDGAELLDRWRRARADLPEGVTWQLVTTDPALAISALIEQRADAAIVSRRATEAEERFAAGDDLVGRPGFEYTVIAREPVSMLVHASNPVEVVALEQARRLVDGTLRDWSLVGGPDAQVTLYAREQTTATITAVRTGLLGGGAVAVEAKPLPSSASVAGAVADDPLGLGLGGGAPRRGVRALSLRDGDELLMPAGRSAAGRSWPMMQELHVVTQGPPSRRVRELIEFAASTEGRSIAEQSGFLPPVDNP